MDEELERTIAYLEKERKDCYNACEGACASFMENAKYECYKAKRLDWLKELKAHRKNERVVAEEFQSLKETLNSLKKRYHEGIHVKSGGNDDSDDILCPICGYSVARNDDYDDMRPKHCPECGTKLIYERKEPESMTNNENIRIMSNEELADFLSDIVNCGSCNISCPGKNNTPSMSYCYCRWLEWLQTEARKEK